MGDKPTGFDREEYDHGTDEYVSDCNRLPFERPFFKWQPSAEEEGFPIVGFLGCLLIVALFFGGCWSLYVVIGNMIRHLLG